MGPYSPPKSPYLLKKQQYFMIYRATETYHQCNDPYYYMDSHYETLHTRISLYRPVPFIIGGPKPFKYMCTS